MTNDAVTEYGSSALAAMGAVTKMMSIGMLVVFGFLKGFQPTADVLAAVVTAYMMRRLSIQGQKSAYF